MKIQKMFVKKFARRFYDMYEYYANSYERQLNQLRVMRVENNSLKRQLETINSVLSREDEILEVVDTKYIVFKEYKSDIVVTNTPNPYNHNYKTKILCSWDLVAKTIHIDDIYSNSYNEGFGTIAMNALFKNAKTLGIEIIVGEMSFVDTEDDEHKERLIKFYTKNGFNINYPHIKKIL